MISLIKSVFIILPAKENACIFYGQIDEKDIVEDLGNTLGSITEYASRLEENNVKIIKISQGKFAYGKFQNFYIITKIDERDNLDSVKDIIISLSEGFYNQFKDKLENNIEDPSVYEKFSENIQEYFTKSEHKTVSETKKTEISKKNEQVSEVSKEPSKENSILELLKKPEPIKLEIKPIVSEEEITLDGSKPLIQPMKREAYVSGIEDYMSDEILWNESQEVMKEYTAEFVEGFIAKLKIFLSISIVHHYELIIDFQNYPQKPQILPSDTMDENLISKCENASYILKNWDPKIPAHIIEIVREIEKILNILKSKGMIEATTELPESMLPELEPLEQLPPLTPEQQKAIEELEASKKRIQIKEIAESENKPKEIIENVPNIEQPKFSTPEEIESKQISSTNITEPKEQQEKKKKEDEKKKKEDEKKKKEEEKRRKEEEKKKLKFEKKEDGKQLKEIMKEAEKEGKKDLKDL